MLDTFRYPYQQQTLVAGQVDGSPDSSAAIIDLWRLDLSNTKLDKLRNILSEDEIQRVNKFVFDKDKNTFARSRCCLRLILARSLQCQPGDLVFDYNEHGRPKIVSPGLNTIDFNLSHSSDMALIAVSRGGTVGIDLNRLGQARDWQPIAKRSFSLAEQKALFLLPEPDREKMFYQIWGQKEAYTKALGDGFSYGFKNFTVVADASGTTGLVVDEKRPESVDDWLIRAINPGPGWSAALAFQGLLAPRIRQWEFCYDK